MDGRDLFRTDDPIGMAPEVTGRDASVDGRRAASVRAREARVGARVRVSERDHRLDLAGQKGTIARIYRSPPNKTALHVRLDDGRWQLLWLHEVEPSGGG